MNRILITLIALLLALSANAGISVKVSVGAGGKIDTGNRDGGDIAGASCSTLTCISLGDADGSIDEGSGATEFDFSASGTNDLDNIDLGHANIASGDIQVIAEINPFTGYTENFSFAGVFIREGVSGGEWFAQCGWPNIGQAKFKTGTAGSTTSQGGATGQFLARYLAITHDDSANETSCWESSDNVDWFEVGTAVSRNVSYPLYYGLWATSHDASETTNVSFENVDFSTTLTITDDGDPPPPTGNDFLIAAGTTDINCNSLGVEPGDTITLDGTSRGRTDISNCIGTVSSPITIRNDVTESGQLVIASTTTWPFECNNCEHVVIDGTGKWSGAGSDGCGMADSWPNPPSNPQCGIKLSCIGDGPQSIMKMRGSSKNYTVKGVEIDGNFSGACEAFQLQTFSTNDHSYDLADHPGEWREGNLITDNYIHDTPRTAMYVGSNIGTSGQTQGDLQQRNNEISYMYIHDAGCDGIKYKTNTGVGLSKIHHNYVDATGLNTDREPATGCTDIGIYLFESGYTDVYNNIVKDTARNSIAMFMQKLPASDFATIPANIYNNLIIDSAINGINVSRQGSENTIPVPNIYNNTIINSSGTNISVSSNVPSGTPCAVLNNVIGDSGSYISASPCNTVMNNRTGTEASHNFVDAAGDDYGLTSSSPARNAATSNAPATDLNDVARPQGSASDQGALELEEP